MRLSNHWSAQPAALGQTQGYRHFALLGQRGRGAERAAELQAVLEPGFRLVVPLAELRQPAALAAWLAAVAAAPAHADHSRH